MFDQSGNRNGEQAGGMYAAPTVNGGGLSVGAG